MAPHYAPEDRLSPLESASSIELAIRDLQWGGECRKSRKTMRSIYQPVGAVEEVDMLRAVFRPATEI